MFKKFALSAITAALAINVASAEVITTLYNTGVDNSHAVVPNGTSNDLHYALLSSPNGNTNTVVRDTAAGWPLGYPWTGDTTTSAWITPESTYPGYVYADTGNYTYRTTFDLTGYDPSSVAINGKWSFDDWGISVLLNGLIVPFSSTLTNVTGFGGYDLFSITSGFQAGINTLDFVVENAGGPGGLRTDFAAEGNRVPLPIPVALLGLGLTGIGLAKRRKNGAVSISA